MIHHVFSFFTEKQKWPQGRYAHLGSGVSQKKNVKRTVRKEGYISQKQQPKDKRLILKEETYISYKDSNAGYAEYGIGYLT